MGDLTLYGRRIETVFDLLGDAEDDITYSVGWGPAIRPRHAERGSVRAPATGRIRPTSAAAPAARNAGASSVGSRPGRAPTTTCA
jgi:hypothetical protein